MSYSFRRRSLAVAFMVLVAREASAQGTTQAPFININPSWSPDGRQLVFESWRHGPGEIYVINADGTGERRLTTSAERTQNTHPSWARDGSGIVFDSDRDGAFNLYLIRPDGTGLRRLTPAGDVTTPNFARHPEWSPDGRYIAFDSDRDGNGEIYVMRADGSGLRRLTNTPANESHAMWTPDSRVVIAAGPREQRVLLTADPASGATQPLNAPTGFYGGLNLSPDGARFIYLSNADSTPRLHVARVDHPSSSRALTPLRNTSYESAWSHDGSRIAFYSDRTGTFELYVADADGGNVRQLTGLR